MTTTSTTSPKLAAAPIAYPLNEFYDRAGLPLPRIEAIAGDAVPEPFRTLLVHANDMTPTLEQFHGHDIYIEVLRRERQGEAYFREVVLHLDGSATPVEFGANKISLARFSPETQRLILEEHMPLGRILRECAVVHSTRAHVFLRVTPDKLIRRALGLAASAVLYGRKAVISDEQGRPLSEIVEILPPVPHLA
jgi:chorismate-pyruvate lyase